MEIKRERNDYHLYDYHIKDKNKEFIIYIGPDRYLHFLIKNELNEKSLEETIFISKGEKVLYSLFCTLYNNLINGKIYEPSSDILAACQTEDDYSLLEGVCIEQNTLIQEFYQNEYKQIVRNLSIFWPSEGSEYTNTTILMLAKEEERIKITFKKNLEKNSRREFIGGREFLDVRVGVTQSHLFPYNLAFLSFYNSLQDFCPNDEPSFESHSFIHKINIT